jgi:hypothetical protein
VIKPFLMLTTATVNENARTKLRFNLDFLSNSLKPTHVHRGNQEVEVYFLVGRRRMMRKNESPIQCGRPASGDQFGAMPD